MTEEAESDSVVSDISSAEEDEVAAWVEKSSRAFIIPSDDDDTPAAVEGHPSSIHRSSDGTKNAKNNEDRDGNSPFQDDPVVEADNREESAVTDSVVSDISSAEEGEVEAWVEKSSRALMIPSDDENTPAAVEAHPKNAKNNKDGDGSRPFQDEPIVEADNREESAVITGTTTNTTNTPTTNTTTIPMPDHSINLSHSLNNHNILDHSKNNSSRMSVNKPSRGRRNSLALRKVPLHFNSMAGATTASSMNSSDLYDSTNPMDAFGTQTATSNTRGAPTTIMTMNDDSTSSHNINSHRSGDSSKRKGGSSASSTGDQKRPLGLLRGTCLNPRFSLQTQLMLSFGFVSVIVISIVVAVCIIVTVFSGQNVNKITTATFDDLAMDLEGTTVRYIAEFLSHRLIPADLVTILWETTRDRMAGYPDAPGFATDGDVPFFDSETQTNRYPIVFPPLPLDWQIRDYANVNQDNYQEHVQDRWSWYQMNRKSKDPFYNAVAAASNQTTPLSTETARYFMQGQCDPSVTDETHPYYYPGCTDANNNISTGGVVAPTDMNALLHRKASDLTPVLKALYEYHTDVKTIGIAFANRGAGSSVQFPLYPIHSGATYVSQGCDWMQQEANPYKPSQTIAGEGIDPEAFSSRCHPAGTEVSYREHNPMEQDWCRKQALEPEKVHIEGPHLDESSWHGIHEYRWTMTVGRALYDRLTFDFIGCIRINVVLDFMDRVLADAVITPNSHVTVVRWDHEGTVVASSARDMKKENQAVTIDQLDVGVTKEHYTRLRNHIDYDIKWNHTDLRHRYETFVEERDGFLIGAYPMPPPPKDYDPYYRPQFFAIKSLSKADVFEQLYVSQGTVDDTVSDLVNLTLLIGVIGLCAVLLIIALVSNRLTSPLRFMNDVANNIVNNYVDNNEDGIDYTLKEEYHSWCTPRTEISEVVVQFQKMVDRFSGTSNAKAMKGDYTEVRNRFEMYSEFADLYTQRQEQSFQYRLEGNPKESTVDTNGFFIPKDSISSPGRKHTGTVLCTEDSLLNAGIERQSSDGSLPEFSFQRKWFFSPLFCWIVLLITTPLLLTTVSLSAIVTYTISSGFPELVEDAKADYLNIGLFALQMYVGLRANFVSEVTSRAARDLHLVNRYTSWLLFDGIERAESFTEMVTGAEECKLYPDLSSCPFIQNVPCDCAWQEDVDEETCSLYDIDSRYLQKLVYSSEALDVLSNGDRNSTSFPEVAYSQETTAWWDNPEDLPGSQDGAAASGYDTAYARFRVLSALPILQPLYNYDPTKEFVEGSYVATEADGIFMGYFGCGTGLAFVSSWQSSQENGGPDTRPELCPVGKFGYDPRCREWYNSGRNKFLDGNTSFYLTPPYSYASGGGVTFAQSVTASIIDPATNRHVGQALVDFLPTPIFATLRPQNTALDHGFPVLITPSSGGFKGDTVIGPGFASDGPAPRIEDLVLAVDGHNCSESGCAGQTKFLDIVSSMKQGASNTSKFLRLGISGSPEEMFIAYAPVSVKALDPTNSSDFSRGVHPKDHLIYSIAFVARIEGILEPFEAIEEDMEQQRNIALAVLVFAIVLSALIVMYISSKVAASIAEPMLYLVELIRHINRLSVEDISASLSPEVHRDYGCREVRHVSSTMEVLHKVVRDANVAFFAGDVETAYAVLTDTLRLFQRLDNKKAIGVSNNNLGNTMLTIYRRMETTKEERVCGFTKKEIVHKGLAYFNKAIKLGETAYDDFYEREGWSPNCLEFMQHLSNRYFNRAMFVLTVKDSHKNPKELEEIGFRDLQIVRDMDVEIVDEGTQVGWNVRGPDQLFDVKLSRIKGHLQLLEMGYPDDWEVDELLEDACKLVNDELKKFSSKLFVELNQAGRIQQVETELMRYLVLKRDMRNAARIAIRMLFEDEYTLPHAQTKAVEVLIEFVKTQRSERYDRFGVERALVDYQEWLAMVDEENDHRVSSEAIDPISNERSQVFHSARISNVSITDIESRRSTIKESMRGDFTMEVF